MTIKYVTVILCMKIWFDFSTKNIYGYVRKKIEINLWLYEAGIFLGILGYICQITYKHNFHPKVKKWEHFFFLDLK